MGKSYSWDLQPGRNGPPAEGGKVIRRILSGFAAVGFLLVLVAAGFAGGPAWPDWEKFGSTRSGAYGYAVPERTVIGSERTYVLPEGESLFEAARRFGLGIHEITQANPGIDWFIPPAGLALRIPTVWILPDARDRGIVINIGEMRLYYFFEAAGIKMVKTFPIGIGREGFQTPLGVYSVTKKIKDPAWYTPKSARQEDPALPRVVPPGPENPLGGYWLQLSAPGIGIHGTNKPWGVGQRISRGCIRLYPEDIPWLFEAVPIGTRVEIVDQPVKIGWKQGRLYLQARHQEAEPADLHRRALSLVQALKPSTWINPSALQRALSRGHGMPVRISG